ncbi:MAG: chemotaxis protein CheW [Phycisphaerae bacterium]
MARRATGFEPTVEAGWHPVVVLVRSGENRVGLVVQNVVQLARVTTRELLPKQESSIEVHDRLIAGAANLNGRTIPLLDMPAILSDHEPSRLAKWESFKQQARLDGIDAEAVVCHG